ncbi:hypothetical protein N7450_006508 [Penicillium hetheringtonii]|uniref:DDE-1 domain-containing protein n=1 Tax=Penicillium hetheringtonii TaxID=911720 RepID=A0AAD6GS70_9EURO|nr:hypothetical protein N7450_006508 [Penicillium hetheringtonii]
MAGLLMRLIFIPYTNSYICGRFCLLILDSYSSYLIPQFDQICVENNIISLCIPSYLLHILQSLDIEYFAVLKYIYGRFVSDLAYIEYNYIDKFDFLEDYQHTQLEAFQSNTIQNSFIATSLVPPIDTERIFSKLNISLQTSTSPNSRLSSRSSQFTPKISRTIVQLYKQTFSLKQLLKKQSNSPLILSKIILDQIIKSYSIALHNTILLAQDNTNLRAANKKKRQKRNRSTRQIAYESGLSVEEDLQLVGQLNQLAEDNEVVSHTHSELPSQTNPRPTRAPSRCSGCGEIGHKITRCKNH